MNENNKSGFKLQKDRTSVTLDLILIKELEKLKKAEEIETLSPEVNDFLWTLVEKKTGKTKEEIIRSYI